MNEKILNNNNTSHSILAKNSAKKNIHFKSGAKLKRESEIKTKEENSLISGKFYFSKKIKIRFY